MNMFLVFILGLAFIATLNYEKKLFMNNVFFFIVSNFIFIFTVSILPEGFADDQYEYFDYMRFSLNEIPSIEVSTMYIASFIPVQIFEFDMLSVRYLFFISFVLLLLKILKNFSLGHLSLLLLLAMPSVFLHSSLFLREPISYVFIILFVYFVLKKQLFFSSLFYIVIVAVRPDSAALVAPFFLFFLSGRRNIQNFGIIFLLILYIYIILFSPLSLLLDGYRGLFSMPPFNLDFNSFYMASKNLLLGSTLIQVETFLIIFETIIATIMIANMKNKNFIILMWFVGILLIGSISNNSGFIIRLRSPLILITVIYFFYERYNLINNNKVTKVIGN
tara:strand:- start:18278 stop:19276 length:999 start_codon:yes stop_codon:yes gene_type:complete